MSQFKNYLETVGEIGYVKSVRGFLVYCTGLAGARISEKVYFEGDQIGFVDSIGPDLTSILLLDSRSVGFGKMVVRTGERLMAPVADEFLGRVVDVFGNPLDGRGKIKNITERELDPAVVPMIDRERTTENLETGVTIVDILIPLGKGQRQLVMGDQKTGKTSFLMQAVARQIQLGAVCIYASIAKKQADLASTVERLKKLGAISKTVVVAAGASAPSSVIYLAPFYAFSLAEHFRDQGQDVLIILDEISRHAKYFREISILEQKMPGREGYPGDIFHLHARLMERAGRFIIGKPVPGQETLTRKVMGKTASITCFPVVQTQGNDITGYIQTNLMSMTDGHIFFDVNRFQQGFRPAINSRLSVTRVGKQTQRTIERDLSSRIRDIIFNFSKAQDVEKFGVELLEATQLHLTLGQKLEAVLDQEGEVVLPRFLQILFLILVLTGFWEQHSMEVLRLDKSKMIVAYNKGFLAKIEKDMETIFALGSTTRLMDKVKLYHLEIEKICQTFKI